MVRSMFVRSLLTIVAHDARLRLGHVRGPGTSSPTRQRGVATAGEVDQDRLAQHIDVAVDLRRGLRGDRGGRRPRELEDAQGDATRGEREPRRFDDRAHRGLLGLRERGPSTRCPGVGGCSSGDSTPAVGGGERRGDERARLGGIDDVVDLEQLGGVDRLGVLLRGRGDLPHALLALLIVRDRLELLAQRQRTAPSRPIGPRWALGQATVSSGSCRLPPTIACAPSP